jgi:VanZ family protein
MRSPGARPQSGTRVVLLARWAAWAALVLVVALMVVPPALRPVSGLPHALEHFLVFLLTGAAFGLGYPKQRFTIAIAALPVTAILELLQLLAPGRHARMSDFLIDALGMCAGIAAVAMRGRGSRRGSQ